MWAVGEWLLCVGEWTNLAVMTTRVDTMPLAWSGLSSVPLCTRERVIVPLLLSPISTLSLVNLQMEGSPLCPCVPIHQSAPVHLLSTCACHFTLSFRLLRVWAYSMFASPIGCSANVLTSFTKGIYFKCDLISMLLLSIYHL